MNIQAVNYKPLRQSNLKHVSFAGDKKEAPEAQEPVRKPFTTKKAIKIGFILGSAIASYGVFKALAPKAASVIMSPIKKLLPSKMFIKRKMVLLRNNKTFKDTKKTVMLPFNKAKQGYNWLVVDRIHSPLVKQMDKNTPKLLKSLTDFKNWSTEQFKAIKKSIKEISIKETLVETGSVVAAIGGGAEAADMVSSKNVKEV